MKKASLILLPFLLFGLSLLLFTSLTDNAMSPDPDLTPNSSETTRNVLGGALQCCCTDPMTGFYRNGNCETGAEDYGTHVVCAEMTEEFLKFTRAMGNDLSTPRPRYRFPGLKPGDKWCLCALRWKEAHEAGFAPPVVLESTHEKALKYIRMEALEAHAISRSADDCK